MLLALASLKADALCSRNLRQAILASVSALWSCDAVLQVLPGGVLLLWLGSRQASSCIEAG
eukprot:m.258438 g.258438  ORF g.258438 m.258438 type:complete len:61 (+) comp21523_c0_seq1:705-887(+)